MKLQMQLLDRLFLVGIFLLGGLYVSSCSVMQLHYISGQLIPLTVCALQVACESITFRSCAQLTIRRGPWALYSSGLLLNQPSPSYRRASSTTVLSYNTSGDVCLGKSRSLKPAQAEAISLMAHSAVRKEQRAMMINWLSLP